MITNITEQLDRDEGTNPCVYKDSRGYETIGRGILVDSTISGAGLRPNEIAFINQNREAEIAKEVEYTLPWSRTLSAARLGVLLNMTFQLGMPKLLEFKKFLAAMQRGDWSTAATEMLDSNWAKQTPERAKRLHDQVLEGVWK